ncbi:CatB-related O-acetyltransferase [Halopseudomonas phragmitis]|uniref:Chloramphenicol acetyltransferase n=2 Tax=Pseudomonadaceae TaxID=135621 RepID=A0A1V0B4F7_9GAMM|nr:MULTISPECIES: CatB-related O-acetyltransferase [Pseudomonadaceae]AQZ94822.1 transferase [Halopseudomonas phragmitis]RHW22984.1 antibiotic acetyltransferase [Pseudomonas jilinensis]
MKALKKLKDYYWKRWLRHRGVKISRGINSIAQKATIILEPEVSLGNVELDTALLKIGYRTYIRSGSLLQEVESIGRYCSIGNNALIGLQRNAHPLHWVTTHPFAYTETNLKYQPTPEPATIEHDVWVGRNAVIMSGVKIYTGAIIAANSVVTKDVPPYTIVGGNPAREIKKRFSPELIERLLASEWWNIEPLSLRELPMDDPTAFLKALETKTLPKARYPLIQVRRTHCHELK